MLEMELSKKNVTPIIIYHISICENLKSLSLVYCKGKTHNFNIDKFRNITFFTIFCFNLLWLLHNFSHFSQYLLFSLFLVLFMDFTALFDTIYEFHGIISTNFYFYLQYFQQKIFNFNKISEFQIDLYYRVVDHVRTVT